jgi:Flp pilus assembly protein TadG
MREERGSAVVDYVLVMVLLVPLVLGILQLGLVLHVRNTLTAAASDGARAAAPLGASSDDAVRRTRAMVAGSLSERFARSVTATQTSVDGAPAVVVRVRAEVPPLGLLGPGVPLDVRGRALLQEEP